VTAVKIRPVPYATLVTLVVTAVPSLVALLSGDPHRGLWRDRGAIADGEWWRLGTSLLFQDGGTVGTLSNLVFLAVIGVLVERALGRWRWIALYLAGAVAGQLAGLAVERVGAGNSIAICGLAGGLLGAYARSGPARNAPVPNALAGAERLPASVCSYFAVLMVSTQFADPTVQTVVAVACGALGLQLVVQRHRLPGWLFPVLGLACALPLAALGNLHGVALLGGGLLGVLVGWPDRSTRPAEPEPPRGEPPTPPSTPAHSAPGAELSREAGAAPGVELSGNQMPGNQMPGNQMPGNPRGGSRV